jgi:hypothetical protein
MSDLYVTPSGFHVARSNDGKRECGLEPDEPCPPGWHLLTVEEFEAQVDELAERAVRGLLERRPDLCEAYRASYLGRLRQKIAERVQVIRDGEGTLLFGCAFLSAGLTSELPGEPSNEDRLSAAFDGLAAIIERHETYVLVVDDEASDWTEAWRVSDRKLARAGAFDDVMDALTHIHRPRSRG